MAPKVYALPKRVAAFGFSKGCAPNTDSDKHCEANPVVASITANLKWASSIPFGWAPAADRGLTPTQLLTVPLDAINSTFVIGLEADGPRSRLFLEEAFSKNNLSECAPKVARATAAKDAVVLTWSFQQCLAAAQTCEWSDPDIEALYSDTLPPPQNYVSTSTADALGIEVDPSATPANVSLCDALLSFLRRSEWKKSAPAALQQHEAAEQEDSGPELEWPAGAHLVFRRPPFRRVASCVFLCWCVLRGWCVFDLASAAFGPAAAMPSKKKEAPKKAQKKAKEAVNKAGAAAAKYAVTAIGDLAPVAVDAITAHTFETLNSKNRWLIAIGWQWSRWRLPG